MSELTTRDKVWAQTLCALMNNDHIRRGDLADSDTNTAQRVLRAMEAMDLVKRDPDDLRTWHRGETWFWMQRATPGAAVEWDTSEGQLVLVEGDD